MYPLIRDPLRFYAAWRDPGKPSVLLESARPSAKDAGRYSLIAKNPFMVFEAREKRITVRTGGTLRTYSGDPFLELRTLLKCRRPGLFPGLPFAGGAIGFFAYEAGRLIEPSRIRRTKPGLGLPDIYFLFFDEGIGVDHAEGNSFLFAPTRERLRRLEADFKKTLRVSESPGPEFAEVPLKAMPAVRASMDRKAFVESVRRAKRHIRAGDIYQANLSQRLSFPLKMDSLAVYECLRRRNPSSFFGHLDAVDFQILSGSPERLIELRKGMLQTRPIAGTRSRGKTAEEDEKKSLELLLDPKERAEHVMLVDLERNDLGRVCEYGSVTVDEFMAIEEYSHVKHIVSNVRGRLQSGLDAVDALKAVFPGGTITGVPKLRCMEIIEELEPVARGPYTGSLGYFSFAGDMDFNILIRSLVLKDGKAHLQVGAGIVADSVPEKEYAETLYKAQGILSALFGERRTLGFFKRQGVAGRLSGPNCRF